MTKKRKKSKWTRRLKQSGGHRRRRRAVNRKLARQLVALWANHRLEQGSQAPLHFLAFCHDIQLFVRRPIDWRRAFQAWKTAITILGSRRELGVPPSEMSLPDAEKLIALEELHTWDATHRSELLSEANSLSIPDHFNFNSAGFRTSTWTRASVSLFDQVAAAIATQLEKDDE